MSDYPQDGSDCCSREAVPEQSTAERCPECKHFYALIEGELNCTWPHCVTNAKEMVCQSCGEDFDADAAPQGTCPFCESRHIHINPLLR